LAHARAAVAVARAFASRYLVASDDPEVREERRKRYYLLGAREAVTYLESIVEHVPSLRPMLELARESVRLREEVFKEAGWSLARPIFPPDEQLRTLRPVSSPKVAGSSARRRTAMEASAAWAVSLALAKNRRP
jgi:hypothetical protein